MKEDSNREKDTKKDIIILVLIILLLYLLAISFGKIMDNSVETATSGNIENIDIFEINLIQDNSGKNNCKCNNICNCGEMNNDEKNPVDSDDKNLDGKIEDEEKTDDNKPVVKPSDVPNIPIEPGKEESGDIKVEDEVKPSGDTNPENIKSGDVEKTESGDVPNVPESGDKCDCETSTSVSGAIISEEKDILVYDEEVVYTMDTPLNIFTHSVSHINGNKIAPGTENIYNFYIKNTNNFDIIYNLYITEENNYNINMKYRLKYKGEYIVGNENGYVSAQELSQTNIELARNKLDEYALEWKWIESDNDTEVGRNLEANYKLNLKIVAQQY